MTTADFVSHPFQGSVLSSTPCELGEGASFDADTGTIWWFSILEKQLRSLDINTGKESVQILPIMGSVLVPIDAQRQLIASDQGLFIRDRATGELTLHCDLEKDKPDNRSNSSYWLFFRASASAILASTSLTRSCSFSSFFS